MAGLHADTAAMDVNGRDTVANAEFFQNELSGLRGNVDSLMTIWRGISATEFNNSYLEQAANLDKFGRLLVDLGEAISKSASILNKTEEENASAGSHLF